MKEKSETPCRQTDDSPRDWMIICQQNLHEIIFCLSLITAEYNTIKISKCQHSTTEKPTHQLVNNRNILFFLARPTDDVLRRIFTKKSGVYLKKTDFLPKCFIQMDWTYIMAL